MSSINSQRGFTIFELLVVFVVLGIIAGSTVIFLGNAYRQFFALQEDSSIHAELSIQSQRIAKVVRGTTDIVSAADNDLSVYAYFSPNDTYVSLIRYYVSGTSILADVTPMTANPPIGTQITASKKTYTIMPNYYSYSNLFTYLDSANSTMPVPIAELHTIKGIRISLAVKSGGTFNPNNVSSVTLSLRNRKTNL